MPVGPLDVLGEGTYGLVKRTTLSRKVYRILVDWDKPPRGLVLSEVPSPGVVAVKVKLPHRPAHSKIPPYS
jgi:hypothetical protein